MKNLRYYSFIILSIAFQSLSGIFSKYAALSLPATTTLMGIVTNTFYILSGQVGRLDVAAVLGSLYPGTTVLLAGLLLHERLNRLQWLGITAALGAIVLMTL